MLWMVIDGNFMAYRCLHGRSSFITLETIGLDLLYGILEDVNRLKNELGCDRVVWCWDGGRLLRCDVDPEYKRRDHSTDTEEDKQLRTAFRDQVNRMRAKYLTNLGFGNVFSQDGYEADDVITSVCWHAIPQGDEAIIISSDKDLWQLLVQDRVSIWNPITGRYTTERSFMQQWRIPPLAWADVKAIAGCSSDNVAGVKGVGEITAVKYLLGELKHDGVAAMKIDAAMLTQIKHNRRLVTLPFPGTAQFTIQADDLSTDRWNYVVDKLGGKPMRCPYQPQAAQEEGFGLGKRK